MDTNAGMQPPMAPVASDAEPPRWLDQEESLLDDLAEYWAELCAHQDWPPPVSELEETVPEGDDERTGALSQQVGQARMAGCQSTNHVDCYGELWQCAACGKTVCYAEGSDDHPELCDDCWCQRYAAQKEADDVPF